MIEAYYAPTALDVVLIVLEGEAELAGEVITSNYDPMMTTTTARTIMATIFFLRIGWFISGKCEKMQKK